MTGARVLIYDIENSPSLGYVWSKYQTDVIQFAQDYWILCFAYKWLGEDQVHMVAQPDFKKAYKEDPTNDYHVVAKLQGLFNEADVLVAHNGIAFDTRKTNTRLLTHGFSPPSSYKQVDTYRVAKRYFSFLSNKLGDLGEALGLGTKAENHGFSTWLGCMAGDKNAWQTMKDYNARDVDLLEQVYLKMRPWVDNHPNVSFLCGEMDGCPKCGSHHLTRQGLKYNKTTTVQQWQCGDCHGWSSSRVSEKVPKPALVN